MQKGIRHKSKLHPVTCGVKEPLNRGKMQLHADASIDRSSPTIDRINQIFAEIDASTSARDLVPLAAELRENNLPADQRERAQDKINHRLMKLVKAA